MGKIIKKGEKLTRTLQVLLTERDAERLKKHPLIQQGLSQAGTVARVWILERLAQEEKSWK